MEPLTKRQAQQHDGESGHSPIAAQAPGQHGQQEHRVVVLGVMYPSVSSRRLSDATTGSLHFPSGVTFGRQSSDVVFYDPISSKGSSELTRRRLGGQSGIAPQSPKRRNTPTDSQASRAEAIEAVVRELARLSLRKHDHERRAALSQGPVDWIDGGH